MRAVLDPDVLISAILSPRGSPARILRAWLDGVFELVVSSMVLEELERALAYPKLRARVEPSEAQGLIELLRRGAQLLDDPVAPPRVHSPDPGDDYLISLAEAAQAVIVSGDKHLLQLAEQLPVFSPTDFVERLDVRADDGV